MSCKIQRNGVSSPTYPYKPKQNTMNVKINIVELASELADLELENNWSDSIQIYVDDNETELIFTDEAQDIFNDLYDKYYNFIDGLKID